MSTITESQRMYIELIQCIIDNHFEVHSKDIIIDAVKSSISLNLSHSKCDLAVACKDIVRVFMDGIFDTAIVFGEISVDFDFTFKTGCTTKYENIIGIGKNNNSVCLTCMNSKYKILIEGIENIKMTVNIEV